MEATTSVAQLANAQELASIGRGVYIKHVLGRSG
jgi:hypothetical protein